jgi:hypothetical protein
MNGQDSHNQVEHMNTTEMNGQDTIKWNIWIQLRWMDKTQRSEPAEWMSDEWKWHNQMKHSDKLKRGWQFTIMKHRNKLVRDG